MKTLARIDHKTPYRTIVDHTAHWKRGLNEADIQTTVDPFTLKLDLEGLHSFDYFNSSMAVTVTTILVLADSDMENSSLALIYNTLR